MNILDMKQEVKLTDNPDIFKFSKVNRDIDFTKVGRLAKAMARNNLLPYYPIIVNKDMVILDGQHRLEAAKQADVLIYYVIADDGYDLVQVAESNSYQNKWKLTDYIKHYSALGYSEYVTLYKYIKMWDLSVSTVLELLLQQTKNGKLIRTGKVKIADEKKALKIYAALLPVSSVFGYWNSRNFVRAVSRLAVHPEFSQDQWVRQLKAQPKAFKPCIDVNEYIKLIERTYNKDLSTKLSVQD